MDRETFETLTRAADVIGDGRELLAGDRVVPVDAFNNPIGQWPPIVAMTIADTEPGSRGDTARKGA